METATVAQARRQVENYLDRAASRTLEGTRTAGGGVCLPFTGGLGAGKTHLLRTVLDDLEAVIPRDGSGDRLGPHFAPKLFSAAGPSGRFFTLYKETLMNGLDLPGFTRVLGRYYAEATADLLTRMGAPGPQVRSVREMKIRADQVVTRFRLSDHDIRAIMSKNLLAVTDQEALASQFALLNFGEMLRSEGRAAAVWEWLSGDHLDQDLKEEGITEPIDSDVKAFGAFTMLAFLYGRAGEPFVFVMDEIERMLQESDRSPAWNVELLQGFERLVNVLIESGGLTIFTVLPDNLERFSGGFHDRVRVLPVEPFDVPETRRLIDKYVSPGSPVRFSEKAVSEITTSAEGNPRFMLNVCRVGWDEVYRPDQVNVVTPPTVRAAIRLIHERHKLSSVAREVQQVLETGGWSADQVGDRTFRISRRADDAAVTVLLTLSILDDQENTRLRRDVDAILARPGQEVIVVVNGYMRPSDRRALAGMLSRQPLIYDHYRFRELLREQLAEAHGRLEQAGRETVLTGIREEVLRIGRQQNHTQTTLELLTAQIQRMQTVAGTGTGAGDTGHGLPERVDRHFTRALSALQGLIGIQSLFRDHFDGEQPMAHRMRPASSREFFEVIGIVVFFQRLVETFMDAVARWLDRAEAQAFRSGLSKEQREELRAICQRYDATAEIIPLFRLTERGQRVEILGLAEQVIESSVRRDAEDALTHLATRVQEELLGPVGPVR
ncbi:hypothetical protein [Sphaerisporangium rubeum]|uniref:Uncharacterized protein n=1 Tax=Sphaerisporangium rubeum TaxID=321317 RepID=A0A7X0I9E7_9ACTN|nr:hypothetical protein [Sphaerisporangium rubeum]MBB6471044.1 hypothetical protein [Sphaerisporangium rubeum]